MKLRNAFFEDWKMLLEWRNDVETRSNSLNANRVSELQHKQWLQDILADRNRQLFVCMENDMPVGTVRADFNQEEAMYKLSWTISPAARGKGIGKQMVRLLTERLDTKVCAEIKKDNIASIKIAVFAGMELKKELDGVLYYANF
jgi:RimJ/RimL family protein N-acetyltransferase